MVQHGHLVAFGFVQKYPSKESITQNRNELYNECQL